MSLLLTVIALDLLNDLQWQRRPPLGLKTSGSNHLTDESYPDFTVAHLVVRLANVGRCGPGAWTGWPGVSPLWLSETEVLVRSLSIYLFAHSFIGSLIYLSILSTFSNPLICRPISLLSHIYKILRRLLQTRIEGTQPGEQTDFRKGYSTTDHLQALSQIKEKSNEHNLPQCIGFSDYEKAFGTVEHFAIFEALRKTSINETHINIVQNIHSQATARIHLDTLVSDGFPINRGVRQGDPLSSKLSTAVMEEVFKKADISERIIVDGEKPYKPKVC